MEFAVCGDLYSHIVKKKRLDESEAAFYFTQIIYGLEEIHKNNIVHRDIKPENLLLKENKVLTIIDFGLSNNYKPGQLLTTACGSPCYAAPEMILGRKYKGLSVDLWSSGIVLYAMVCGYLPFEDQVTERVYKKILSGRFEMPEHLSKECRDLLSKILTVNPNKRISLEEIKQHPFLKLSNPVYHIDDNFDFKEGKVKYCSAVLDKMINNMPGFNFTKQDIIYNLSHNKHNNITTTYELLLKKYKLNSNVFSKSMSNKSKNFTATQSQQSISLNTTTSPIKASDDKMKVSVKNYYVNTTTNNKRLSTSLARTSREKKHQSILSNSLYTKTLESNASNKSGNTVKRNNFKKNNNDVSISLDVSKIIKKNKIDSNIIIGIPKLVPVNKTIFAKLSNKNNKFYYKEVKALNHYYRKNIIESTQNDLNSKLYSSRGFSNTKNNAINTSVTYEKSPHRFDYAKSKNKQMMYIPSNTINLIDDNSSQQKSVNHYSSYSVKKNASKSSINSNNSSNRYQRSQSANDKENNLSFSNSVGCSSGSARKYLMTFSSESNNLISTSSLNSNYRSNRCETSSHLFKTTNYFRHNNNNNDDTKSINSASSNSRTKSQRRKFKNSTTQSSLKCSSPIPNTMINRGAYCPSFTENTLPISFEKATTSKNTKTPVKKASDISISIKKEITNRHAKKESMGRQISPVSIFKKTASKKKENKIVKNKPTVVGIDITNEVKEIKPPSAVKSKKVKSSASNSQKSIKTTNALRTGSINSKNNKNTKKNHIHTHDIGIVDLSEPEKPTVKRKSKEIPEIKFDLEEEAEIKNKMLTSSKDFVLWTTSLPHEDIIKTLRDLCKENTLTLTEVDTTKFICKKDSDNSINIEISSNNNSNVLKMYHLNGQESITKEVIKKIIKTIGL